MSIFSKIWDAIKKALGLGGGSSTTTTTTPANSDKVEYSKLLWNRGGASFTGAVRDNSVTLTSANVSGNNLTYNGTGLTIWPLRSFNPDGNINCIVAIFFDDNKDGTYERGGKFDWGRSNAAMRPLKHIEAGYNGWDGYPSSGTPWAMCITTEAGDKRSNVMAGIWP